ncbi:MAG: carboxypeptidase regulatory-like domain-containing protein [Planctomycetes bacterium]|nr:carboxypeptidase regulatory-like domain-containing protein [Planctomycetota bacterium]
MHHSLFGSVSVVSFSLVVLGCGGASNSAPPAVDPPAAIIVPPGEYRVLANNDLGMHCMDREFSVFSILPPFNVVNAQVVRRVANGTPQVLLPGQVELTYAPVADAHGSINSRSIGKTDFWAHVNGLFGVTLPPGQGVTGLYMPADAPTPGPQPLAWNDDEQLFRAFGIPITPVDDLGGTNPYPLLRIQARNPSTGQVLASTDVVVPVASETDCRNCHLTGTIAASDPTITWSNDPDPEIQSKRNVLILHDANQGTDLLGHQPVLCASCHYSPPLDLAGTGAPPHSSGTTIGGGGGNPGVGVTVGATSTSPAGNARQLAPSAIPKLMSSVMHSFHGMQLDAQGQPVFPPGGSIQATCYQCHPGAQTECLRGAMKTGGMDCYSCHGDMLAVGGAYPLVSGGSLDGAHDGEARRPWMDLPRCQSCHTGDATNHLTGPNVVLAVDGIRLRQAWRVGDTSASPISAPSSRFAENPNTLYRFSKGHGEIACEACHGSTHAEWPNALPAANDNVAANQVQGHSGSLIECAACHAPGTLPTLTLGGPHGMHQVNSASFVHDHHELYETQSATCRACHGATLAGTALSRAADARTWNVEGQTISVAKGTPISCTLCHEHPDEDDD